MKKNYIYIFVLIIILISGYLLKAFIIEDSLNRAEINYKKINDIQSNYIRDSLIQKNRDNLKLSYETNKRGNAESVQLKGEIISIFETMSIKSKIKLGKDNIISGEEIEEGKVSYFPITLRFEATYNNLIELLNEIYRNEAYLTIERMTLNKKQYEEDEENKKSKEVKNENLLDVVIDLNVIKLM
ncbi:MAG: hypothetical protein CR982_01455 [Candidatus Cloacimonadota bacterium]|nr:MAG: hypothetical protein CR982_01455 [Candidatus Cloacimonadota bacterium]PIE77553.1 MAG: hypothetical protein CSA15_12320 [Candidatus Delongbacteria bacterium]